VPPPSFDPAPLSDASRHHKYPGWGSVLTWYDLISEFANMPKFSRSPLYVAHKEPSRSEISA
jgi:hypothetical protein